MSNQLVKPSPGNRLVCYRSLNPHSVVPILNYLRPAIGIEIIQTITGADSAQTVTSWQQGDIRPTDEIILRLEMTHRFVQNARFGGVDNSKIRRWFETAILLLGMDPELDSSYVSPAEALRENYFKEVHALERSRPAASLV